MRSLEEALASAVRSPDEADGRVFGWIPGIVTDLDTKLMRVKARIGKQEDGDSTDWLLPSFGGSVEELPEIGDPVAVDFKDGDPHRGRWSWFPQSNTQNRATEALALGTTLVAMFNQLQTDLQTLTTAYMTHKHTGVTTGLGSSAITDTPVFAPSFQVNVGQGQASDGSVVAPKSGNQKVLSKRGKVR